MESNNLLLSNIIEAHWKPFISEIKSGLPVYFSFTKDMEREILHSVGISSPDPVAYISKILTDFLILDGDPIIMKESLFQPVWNGISPTILIVALQVIATELMIDDDRGNSDDAYFPRLRQLLSPDIELSKNIPFTREDFDRSWSLFEREIFLLGGKMNSITFSKGVGPKNINRGLPLSQALLTQSEVIKVVSLVKKDSSEGLSSRQNISFAIRKVSSKLGPNILRKLRTPQLRDKILDQILQFFNRYGHSISEVEPISIIQNKDKFLRIFLEDFPDETFYIEACDDAGKIGPLNVELLFEKTAVLVAYRTSSSDFFWSTKDSISISEIHDLVIVSPLEKKGSVKYFTDKAFDSFSVKKSINLQKEKLQFAEITTFKAKTNFLVKEGIPSFIETRNFKENKVYLAGGLEYQKSRYISGYSYSRLYKNELEVPLREKVQLDGATCTVNELLKKLSSIRESCAVSIKIFDELFILHFDNQLPNAKLQIFGNELLDSGAINPIVTEIFENDSALIGYAKKVPTIDKRKLRRGQLAILLDKSKYKNGLTISEEQLDAFIEVIAQMLPRGVAALAKKNIKDYKTVPTFFEFLF